MILYRVPTKDSELRDTWLKNLNLTEIKVEVPFIRSLHFSPRAFIIKNDGRRELLKDSIPEVIFKT